MDQVSSVDRFYHFIQKVKLYKRGYLTNFFLDIPKMELWIRMNLAEFEEIGASFFISRKNQGFSNIFFITTDTDALSRDIDVFLQKNSGELYVIDLVGKSDYIEDLTMVLMQKGFYKYTSLVRMSKNAADHIIDNENNLNISYADKSAAYKVYNLLNEYFDPYAEQIPLSEEIYNLAEKNNVVICADESSAIQGFMIFELNGLTSFLRYWFVHPEHRDKKIGSALLKRFFSESINTKRKLFWVIRSNENAIKRYEHFGFVKEELYDNVMINKNLSYEG